MQPLSDEDLLRLLSSDVDRGWRAFVDQYTPTLLALLARASLRDRDEAMEVYTLVCERLAADDCGRLRRFDPRKGSLGAWLGVVVRHAIVDWVRTRAGRRRLFGSIREMDELHQQVFELYFWEDRPLAEIGEELTMRLKRPVPPMEVLDALDDIHRNLTERQRSELLSAAARSRPAVSLEAVRADTNFDPVDAAARPDEQLQAVEDRRAFEQALAELPVEDAAIVRLRYGQGLSLSDVQRALHRPGLTDQSIRDIVERLRQRLMAGRAGGAPVPEGGTR